MRPKPITLVCPMCGGAPLLATPELIPWFCVNDDCIALAWDPYSTLEELLTDARHVTETHAPE
jgi:hypothetical protein